jgi:hypothetical protein
MNRTGYREHPEDQTYMEGLGGVRNPANVAFFHNDPARVARRAASYQQNLGQQREERLGVQANLAGRFGQRGQAQRGQQRIRIRRPARNPATVGGGGSGGAAPQPNPQGTVNQAQASVRSVAQLRPVRTPKKAVTGKSPLMGRPVTKPRKPRAVDGRVVKPVVRSSKPLRKKVILKEESKNIKKRKAEKETRTIPKPKEKTKAAEGTVSKSIGRSKPKPVQTAPSGRGVVKGETTRPMGRGIQSAEGTIGSNQKKKSMRY